MVQPLDSSFILPDVIAREIQDAKLTLLLLARVRALDDDTRKLILVTIELL